MSEFLDLSKFNKKDNIGHGAFGQVYKVEDIITNKILAAKISFTELDQNDITSIMNIKQEVNILSQLNHPSVLSFIGYSPLDFDQNPYPVIITEYCQNGSLSDLIEKDRNLTAPKIWTDTKKLINIYGIASAMKYLHSNNIIHRDLKPANILEDENLFPKISDFGLSKSYKKSDSNESKLASGILGTPIYIAPEIWSDKNYTEAGDVYAFAIIVYEILTLDEPFENCNGISLMVKVGLKGERPEIKYPLPHCYEDLIEKCWSSDPKDRPTFNQIVEQIRTNKNFIIESIDENEFFKYVDFIDNLNSSFNRNMKLKTFIMNNSKENDENEITIGAFNSLSLKSQYLTISKIIERNNNETLISLQNLLKYLKDMNPKEEEKYIFIPTKNENLTIEEIFEIKNKVSISYATLEMINEHENIEQSDFFNHIKNFDLFSIELQYPNASFDTIYEQIITHKQQYEYKDKLRINIFINGINKTDMRFQKDNNIYSVFIGSDVLQITDRNISSFEKEFEYGSFYECTSLRKIYLLSSLNLIEKFSFAKCLTLKEISIPSSVTSIGDFAFEGCSSLTQIYFEIPSSVTQIGVNSFEGCSSLAQISIPSSVTEIGICAFSKCSLLTRVEISSSITSIANNLFSKCSLLRIISIPSSVTSIGSSAFSECSSLTQITIPSSVTSIGSSAFSECSSLTTIRIPSSVTEIGDSAFLECSSLTQITIPSSVTSIGNNAFSFCKSLTQITIPSSVTEIGNYAFTGCSSLTQITIPSSVTSIGSSTFKGCSSLTQITIPSSVTEIGDYAFKGCSSLTQIAIPSSITSIGKHAFDGCKLHAPFENKKNNSIPHSQEMPIYYSETLPDQKRALSSSQNEYELIQCIAKLAKGNSMNEYKKKLNEVVNHFKELVKNGYVFSYFLLSLVYYNFYNKYVSAFNFANDGARLGDRYCKCIIGYYIAHGIGSKKNFTKGVSIILSNKIPDFYELFATDIGIYYTILVKEQKKELEKDQQKDKIEYNDISTNDEIYEITAFKWFELAFKNQKTKATINNLGICYLIGYGVEKNIEKAKEIFQIGLDQNDPDSMYHVGYICEEDQNKSILLYKKAADRNHERAQVQYAFKMLQINKEESLKYFTISSENGDSISQISLAKLIKDKSPDFSLHLYKEAASNGNIEAQEFLASKFANDNDTENINKYFNMLINNGNFRVPIKFAVSLYKAQKFDQAFYYFSLISKFNHPIARYFLGVMKFYGQGCDPDKMNLYIFWMNFQKKELKEQPAL